MLWGHSDKFIFFVPIEFPVCANGDILTFLVLCLDSETRWVTTIETQIEVIICTCSKMSVLFYGDEVSLHAGRVTAQDPLIKAIQCSVVCQVTTSLHYFCSIHTISVIHRDSKEGLTQKHYCGDTKKWPMRQMKSSRFFFQTYEYTHREWTIWIWLWMYTFIAWILNFGSYWEVILIYTDSKNIPYWVMHHCMWNSGFQVCN